MVSIKTAPPPSNKRCPQGHALAPVYRAFHCDLCPAQCTGISLCCMPCDYDVCPTHVLPGVTMASPVGDVYATPLLCPLNHVLYLRCRTIPWYCNRCNANCAASTVSLYCGVCDYDECYSHRLGDPAGTSTFPMPTPVATTPFPVTPEVVPRGIFSNTPKVSNEEVKAQMDDAAKGSGYRCTLVSWEDANRGTVGGTLSCWGGNISDVRLWERSGAPVYTCRSENWNERLGFVSPKDVAVVVGNETASTAAVRAVTLENYLRSFGNYSSYAGVDGSTSLLDPSDTFFSIRFQTVFLPVQGEQGTEFCTEVYNYNTKSDDDPRNVLLLCTPQGTSVQQDGQGRQRLYHHEFGAGRTQRYWLKATKSTHAVGGAQQETAEEAQQAAARGESTAIHIGTRAMGTRFNVQMLIQMPIKQKPRPQSGGFGLFSGGRGGRGGAGFGGRGGGGIAPAFGSCAPPPSMAAQSCAMPQSCAFGAPASNLCFGGGGLLSAKRCRTSQTIGESNAARVSRGSLQDVWDGVLNTAPQRDASMHGTITVTLYYTVARGVPSSDDVRAAIKDLNELYNACPTNKRLASSTEVTSELTVQQANQLWPKAYAPVNAFPS